MNWSDYKHFSEKTLSTEFHCGKQVENLLHGVIGILTELEELLSWDDEVNKKEEVADIFWYIALLDRELNLNLVIPKTSDLYQLKNESITIQTIKLSCSILDQLKKKIYYNKSIEFDSFNNQVTMIFDNMCLFCHFNDISVESILDTNIQKLKARYGDKFSSEKAINRNIELERTILEQ